MAANLPKLFLIIGKTFQSHIITKSATIQSKLVENQVSNFLLLLYYILNLTTIYPNFLRKSKNKE